LQKEIKAIQRELNLLKQRQNQLETRLNRLELNVRIQSPASDSLDPPSPEAPLVEEIAAVSGAPWEPALNAGIPLGKSAGKAKLELKNYEDWIGLKGFSLLGIFALIMGLGLFVRYAYTEGWLGPWSVLFSGFAASLALLGLGEWMGRKERYRSWSHALMGGGIALLYFLIYGAYHFSYFRKVTHLSELTDCLLLMGVVGLAIYLALKRKSQSLASRAFVLGFLTSLLSQQFDSITLFYNLFLSLGLALVAGRCGWGYLGLVGAIGTWILHLFWYNANPERVLLGFGTLLIFSTVYSVLGEMLETRPETPLWARGTPILAFSLLGFSGLSLYMELKLAAVWVVSGSLLWLGIHLFLVYRRLQRHPGPLAAPLEKIYVWPWGIALGLIEWSLFDQQQPLLSALLMVVLALGAWGWSHFLSARAPELADALWFWILTAAARAIDQSLTSPYQGLFFAALANATWFKPNAGPILRGSALLLNLSTLILLMSHDFQLYAPGLQLSAVLIHGLLLALFQLQFWLAIQRDNPQIQIGQGIIASLGLMGWFFYLVPEGWISAVWILLGCAILMVGFFMQARLLRYQGIGILALSSIRVFLYDIQQLSLGFKILSLVGLGVCLLAMALVYTRFHNHPEQSEQLPSEAPADLPPSEA